MRIFRKYITRIMCFNVCYVTNNVYRENLIYDYFVAKTYSGSSSGVFALLHSNISNFNLNKTLFFCIIDIEKYNTN